MICDRNEMIKNKENIYFVKTLETGYVVLGDVQKFYGYTLFLCKIHKNELFDLEFEFREKFLYEMTIVSNAVFNVFNCEKINYELLGNGDSHLHWHLFPRRKGDLGNYGINGKGPVWWLPYELMYSDKYVVGLDELEKMKSVLSLEIDKLLGK